MTVILGDTEGEGDGCCVSDGRLVGGGVGTKSIGKVEGDSEGLGDGCGDSVGKPNDSGNDRELPILFGASEVETPCWLADMNRNFPSSLVSSRFLLLSSEGNDGILKVVRLT